MHFADGVDNAKIISALAEFNAADNAGRPPIVLEGSSLGIPEPARFFFRMVDKVVAEFIMHMDPLFSGSKPPVLLAGGVVDSRIAKTHLTAELSKAGFAVITIPNAGEAVVRGAIISALRFLGSMQLTSVSEELGSSPRDTTIVSDLRACCEVVLVTTPVHVHVQSKDIRIGGEVLLPAKLTLRGLNLDTRRFPDFFAEVGAVGP